MPSELYDKMEKEVFNVLNRKYDWDKDKFRKYVQASMKVGVEDGYLNKLLPLGFFPGYRSVKTPWGEEVVFSDKQVKAIAEKLVSDHIIPDARYLDNLGVFHV